MKPLNLAKDELEKLYWGDQLSLNAIASRLRCNSASVHAWMVRHGIPRRSMSEADSLWVHQNPEKHHKFTPWLGERPKKYDLNIELAKTLYLDMGFGVPEVARILGFKPELIRYRLAGAGTVFRKRGEALRGRKRPDMTKRNRNPAFQKRLAIALQRKPNKPEKYLDGLLQRHFPNQWEYVGDGKILVHGLAPDFINCNGHKATIEVFGDYWHRSRENIPVSQTDYGRRAIFAKYGYRTLILWESELAQLSESEIVAKVEELLRAEE